MDHLVNCCSATAHLRHRDFTEEEWAGLPMCLRLHGIAPLGDGWLPPRLAEGDRAKEGVVGDVQYALIDMLAAHHQSLEGEVAPAQPRWRG